MTGQTSKVGRTTHEAWKGAHVHLNTVRAGHNTSDARIEKMPKSQVSPGPLEVADFGSEVRMPNTVR